jgi:hypothetical protein
MAGPNVYDKIINGSFDAVGAPPSYISTPYRAEDYASIYAQPSPGIRPSWTMPATPATSPYMTGPERLKLEQQIAASKALQAGYTGQAPTAVAGVPLPRPRPWEAPTSIDVASAYAPAVPVNPVNPAVAAAAGAANPVTNVTGQMKPAQSGGLLDLLFGPSKNGMSGLLGLLGGPQAGGLLGMLMQQRPSAPATAAPRSVTPSQAYALANSAARERAGALIGHSGSGSSSGNLMGVSSSGRRFDLDTNQWAGGSSSKSSSSSGSRNNEYLGASN